MKIIKTLLKGCFWVLILCLLIAPLGIIYRISVQEMEAYQAPEAPIIRESAFGDVVQAIRSDVPEYITVTGQFVSHDYGYQELNQRKPDQIRWEVNSGEEIHVGQVLGIYQGNAVLSEVDGILEEINVYGNDPYLKVKLLTNLELECQVSPSALKALNRAEVLKTVDDAEVRVSFISHLQNADGTTTVRLTMDSAEYIYGMELKNLQLYTGNVYTGSLVLPEKCLYQKEQGEDQPWYVRQVTEDGYYISEVTVQRGYSNGDYVCVTGIDEGTWYDAGYKLVAEGDWQ